MILNILLRAKDKGLNSWTDLESINIFQLQYFVDLFHRHQSFACKRWQKTEFIISKYLFVNIILSTLEWWYLVRVKESLIDMLPDAEDRSWNRDKLICFLLFWRGLEVINKIFLARDESTVFDPHLFIQWFFYQNRRENQGSRLFNNLNKVFQDYLSELFFDCQRLKKINFRILHFINKLNFDTSKIYRGTKYNNVKNNLIEIKLANVMLMGWDLFEKWIVIMKSKSFKILFHILVIDFCGFQNNFTFNFVLLRFMLFDFLETYVLRWWALFFGHLC